MMTHVFSVLDLMYLEIYNQLGPNYKWSFIFALWLRSCCFVVEKLLSSFVIWSYWFILTCLLLQCSLFILTCNRLAINQRRPAKHTPILIQFWLQTMMCSRLQMRSVFIIVHIYVGISNFLQLMNVSDF